MNVQKAINERTSEIHGAGQRFVPPHTSCPLESAVIEERHLGKGTVEGCNGRCQLCPIWLEHFYNHNPRNLFGDLLVA